jgi:hypothetical protein
VYNDIEPWKSIYWYQRYVFTKARGYGYAALLISKQFRKMGDIEQADYWLQICKTEKNKFPNYKCI